MEKDHQLYDAVVRLVEKAEHGVDYAIDQAPVVVKQFLIMERIWFSVDLFLALIVAPLFLYIGHKYAKRADEIMKAKDSRYFTNQEIGSDWAAFFSTTTGLIIFVSAIVRALNNLSAWIAPQYHIVKAFL